jgi:DNA-binding CsgD family transcriptional regulator
LQSQKDLLELTRILLEKNTALMTLEGKISFMQEDPDVNKTTAIEVLEPIRETSIPASTDKDDFEKHLYNQSILTNADWTSFKNYFEKAYPGYILKLRNAHDSITEAEERMFLFIKLNLTNKESAAMLGISVDSIKKTRHRLRKRLNIDEETDLDGYVKNF